jgi:hypothetical protein
LNAIFLGCRDHFAKGIRSSVIQPLLSLICTIDANTH